MTDRLDRIRATCEASLLERLVGMDAGQAFLARARDHLSGSPSGDEVEAAALLDRDDEGAVSETLRLIARLVGADAFEAVAVGLASGADPGRELARLEAFGYPRYTDPTLELGEDPALVLAPFGVLLLRVPPHTTGRYLAPLVEDAQIVRLYDPSGTVQIPDPIEVSGPGTRLERGTGEVYPDPLPRGFNPDTAGQGVRVAVVDSGIDDTHPALKGKVVKRRDFTSEGPEDRNGHGTHCAGIIAASTGPRGYRGVAPGAQLIDAKVLNESGTGGTLPIAQAIRWAMDQGAQVINLSLGSQGRTDGRSLLSRVVDEVSQQGVVVAVAAGNAGYGGRGTIGTPGDAAHALTVGALDRSRGTAPFSSRGPTDDPAVTGDKPNLAAPGVDIRAPRSRHSRQGQGDYIPMSGTSMAAPFVAGAAAALLGWNKGLQANQVRQLLLDSCIPLKAPDEEVGRGLLNISAALKSAKTSGGALALEHPRRLGTAAAVLAGLGVTWWALSGTPEPTASPARTEAIVRPPPAQMTPVTSPLDWGLENTEALIGPPTARDPSRSTLHPPETSPDHVLEGCYRLWSSEGVMEKVVTGGDSLSKWAAWFSVPVADIARWNGFSPDVQLLQGDRLLLSLEGTRTQLETVADGETLQGVLKRHGIPNPWFLRAWNCLPASQQLQRGQPLLLLAQR